MQYDRDKAAVQEMWLQVCEHPEVGSGRNEGKPLSKSNPAQMYRAVLGEPQGKFCSGWDWEGESVLSNESAFLSSSASSVSLED